MSRVHHPACRVAVEAWGGREAFDCDDAEVWIDGDAILVSYFDDEGIVVLEGRREGTDGWRLTARSRPRRAFLRPMDEAPGSFVGEIDEQGEVAGWRLSLGPPGTEGGAPESAERE